MEYIHDYRFNEILSAMIDMNDDESCELYNSYFEKKGDERRVYPIRSNTNGFWGYMVDHGLQAEDVPNVDEERDQFYTVDSDGFVIGSLYLPVDGSDVADYIDEENDPLDNRTIEDILDTTTEIVKVRAVIEAMDDTRYEEMISMYERVYGDIKAAVAAGRYTAKHVIADHVFCERRHIGIEEIDNIIGEECEDEDE